jgi:uncharacterized phage infection (PIP) family protein YhgE
MEDGKIDLVRYGVLWQKVENYEDKFDAMQKKMDKMEANIEKLLDNQSQQRGASWLAIGMLTALSTMGGWAVHWFSGK